MKQRTFFMIKPDCASNPAAILDINRRLADAGLEMVAHKTKRFSREELVRHYADVSSEPFFEDLVEYMTRGPAIMLVLEGENAVGKARELLGATHPRDWKPDTIRFTYGKREVSATGNIENCAHASDSELSAVREIKQHFPMTSPYAA